VTYILEKLYILAKFQIHFINFKFHFLSYDGVISEHDMKKLLRLFIPISRLSLPFLLNSESIFIFRKRERNREAASKCRQRKLQRIAVLFKSS